MKKEHKVAIVAYLVGSFFPLQSILGLFGGFAGRGQRAAADVGSN